MSKKFIRFEDYEDRIKQALDDKIGIDKNFSNNDEKSIEDFILIDVFLIIHFLMNLMNLF